MEEATKKTRVQLSCAIERQMKYANQCRRLLKFVVGDQVFLKVSPTPMVKRFGFHHKLSPRFVGPYAISERIGGSVYRLDLPASLAGVHDVFHVSQLGKYIHDPNRVLKEVPVIPEANLSYPVEPVSPTPEVKRFGRHHKLSPRFVGPYAISERIGGSVYHLELPASLAGVHDVFHVSQLRKYIHDPNCILEEVPVISEANLSYPVEPANIVEYQEGKLCKRIIPMVKVLWVHGKSEEVHDCAACPLSYFSFSYSFAWSPIENFVNTHKKDGVFVTEKVEASYMVRTTGFGELLKQYTDQ
ncbi:hypothetical protein KSP39_PZI005822 [Platanthera zijinensis]|uniref:Tf2-1-like SH3-like domain-containing protein n=1 Tax=Platanthera zijinensis TaxID=2320716 RepID=A0AAP0GAI8_9ASPA